MELYCISLNEQSIIRLMGFPKDIPSLVVNCIEKAGYGIVRQQLYYEAFEIKIKGEPWMGKREEAVKGRLIIKFVLEEFLRNGFELVCALDLSALDQDKDSLYFRKCRPIANPTIMCMTLNESNKIRLIGAPDSLPNIVENVIDDHWKKGRNEKKLKPTSSRFLCSQML
jgi:hypothetical protein